MRYAVVATGAQRATKTRRRRNTAPSRRRVARELRAQCTDSVDTQYARADSVTCVRIILLRFVGTLSRTRLRTTWSDQAAADTNRRVGQADRRSREGRSMDRSLAGRVAMTSILSIPPGGAATARRPGGRRIGDAARRGMTARMPDPGNCTMGHVAPADVRATRSARLGPSRTHLLSPGTRRLDASRPHHRNARRHHAQ